MNAAALTAAGDGRWVLDGVLDFSTVPTVWPTLEKLLKAGGAVSLSLAKVSKTNSAGLVMLVEARDLARRSGCRLELLDIPAEMLALARMSRCETLLSRNAA